MYELVLAEAAPKSRDAGLLHELHVFPGVPTVVNMDTGVVAPEIREAQQAETITKMDMEFRWRAWVARQGKVN
jgi:hypothetical protein